MSEQSTRAVGLPPFEPEDFAFTAKLLRKHCQSNPTFFEAVCSNNLNIILAALDHLSGEETQPGALQPIGDVVGRIVARVTGDEQEASQ